MTNKFVNILNLCGDIILVVHVGKLETLLRIDCAELSDKNQAKILSVFNSHIADMDTSRLLAKLSVGD